MGMFDTIRCLYPLPNYPAELGDKDPGFQTKSLDCGLDNYLITADGRLLVTSLPDEGESDYNPVWDECFYTGEIRFYTSYGSEVPRQWLEYIGYFQRGRLVFNTLERVS